MVAEIETKNWAAVNKAMQDYYLAAYKRPYDLSGLEDNLNRALNPVNQTWFVASADVADSLLESAQAAAKRDGDAAKPELALQHYLADSRKAISLIDGVNVVNHGRGGTIREKSHAELLAAVQKAPAAPAAAPDPALVQAHQERERKAEQGDAIAQHNIGVDFQKGRGVKQDDAKALAWYAIARANGMHPEGNEQLIANKYVGREAEFNKIAQQAQTLANNWLTQHPNAVSSPQTGDASATAAAPEASAASPSAPAAGGYAHIDSKYQQLLESKRASGGEEYGTGKRNSQKFDADATATLDEKLGNCTARAIRAFEKANGLAQTSVADLLAGKIPAATLEAMDKEIAAKGPVAAAPTVAATPNAGTQDKLTSIVGADAAAKIKAVDASALDVRTLVADNALAQSMISDSMITAMLPSKLAEYGIKLSSAELAGVSVQNGIVSSELLKKVEHSLGLAEDGKIDNQLLAALKENKAQQVAMNVIAADQKAPGATPQMASAGATQGRS